MKFGAVIVTYNRIDHLKRSIKNYTHQTLLPDRILVVNNASTDGTFEFLEGWKHKNEGVIKQVIHLPENSGGSGGFYTGLKQMQEYEDIDWIWVADDDAYPALDAFEKAKQFIEGMGSEIDDVAAVCGGVGADGRYSDIQRFYLNKSIFGVQEMPIPHKWFKKKIFDIGMYSFVGTFMKRENLIKAGLPRKDFFIYQDDLEHAVRMRKTGRIICNTAIHITHRDNSAPANEVSWRDYYASRNITAMYKDHFDKWSLFCRLCRRVIFASLTLNFKKTKVVLIGIKDGLKGNMGIHPVYKPGWKA